MRKDAIMRKLRIHLLLPFVMILITACAENDPFPNVDLPVCSSATNLKTHLNKPAKGVKAITYQITTTFPAREITGFYNTEIDKKGFVKYHDPQLALKEFEWNTFNSRTGNWEIAQEPPARYSAKWVGHKKDQFVWLNIDFKTSSQDNKQNGTALVSVHVARFSDYSAERNVMRK